MGNFLYPVSFVLSEEVDASSVTVAATVAVKSGLKHGRRAVGISATSSDVYIGGEDVTSSTGLPVPAGSTFIMPVLDTGADGIYVVGGTCVITDFF